MQRGNSSKGWAGAGGPICCLKLSVVLCKDSLFRASQTLSFWLKILEVRKPQAWWVLQKSSAISRKETKGHRLCSCLFIQFLSLSLPLLEGATGVTQKVTFPSAVCMGWVVGFFFSCKHENSPQSVWLNYIKCKNYSPCVCSEKVTDGNN